MAWYKLAAGSVGYLDHRVGRGPLFKRPLRLSTPHWHLYGGYWGRLASLGLEASLLEGTPVNPMLSRGHTRAMIRVRLLVKGGYLEARRI